MFSKLRRKDDDNNNNISGNLISSIITAPNPLSPATNIHIENRLRHESGSYEDGAGFNINSLEYKMSVWLQSHSVWFNDKIGNKLMSVLKESGITSPDTELKLLKEWPDLIQISDAANLNIIQRRKFINAVHDPMDNIKLKEDYTTNKLKEVYDERIESDEIITKRLIDNIHHLPLGFFIPGPESYYDRYNILGQKEKEKEEEEDIRNVDELRARDNEIKHILVMSDKEQEALARMDSIISQLHITRNLIRRRCEALDSGARECENIIRSEFNLLRSLLSEREEYIISDLNINKDRRIKQLNDIDIDIESSLLACHKSKYFVECIVENDTQYSGASWAVLTARKSRAIQQIEKCIEYEVAKNDIFDEETGNKKRYSISSLIHTDMDIDNLLAFETFGTAQNIDVGQTKIHDWNTLSVSPIPRRQSTLDINNNNILSPFKELLFKNLKKLEDIEQEAVQQHGFGENSYATHELNVFVRSPSQLRLRMCLPGFSFQRTQKRMHEMIRSYGAITDVEKSVDCQLNQLFKCVAKIPQHTISAINVNIDKASFVNEITKEFDDETEIYKFDNHRSLSVEVTVKPNPDDAVKAAKLINEEYGIGADDDDDDNDDDINSYYDEYGSPVNIVRIFEVELQICRQPIPPQEAIDNYLKQRKRRDSYDSEDERELRNNGKIAKYDLNQIDPTLLDWISLGWKKIKSQKFHKDRYDEELEKMRKNIDIKFSEEWWKEQRVKLLSKVNLNEWPLKHKTGCFVDADIENVDEKSQDNIICNDLLIRCRIRDFLKISISKQDTEEMNEDNKDKDDDDDENETTLKLMSIRDEILVSQSSYSSLYFMKYDLRLPPEEPEDHFGVLSLYSDRSIRFHDLYDNKLIILSQGVPGDHISLPGLCAGSIPYEKANNNKKKMNNIGSDTEDDIDADSENSDNSDSDTLSVKPGGSMTNFADNESETEYELKPSIIRCGGSLLKIPTNYVDIFDIERMIWYRIQHNMHCKRVYTQSIIVNGKLIVIGGEVFYRETKKEKKQNELKQRLNININVNVSNIGNIGNIGGGLDDIDTPSPHKRVNSGSITDEDDEKGGKIGFALTRRISAINEDDDDGENDGEHKFSSILRVQENKSCIEEYDFELKRWDISYVLPDCIWMHSVCSISKSYDHVDAHNQFGIVASTPVDTFHSTSNEIFIGGGYSTTKNKYLSQCMIYDIMKDSLINISSMKYLHSCSTAITFDFNINGLSTKSDNKIYVIGGQLMGVSKNILSQSAKNKLIQSMISKQFKCVEVYNLNTKKWQEIESLKYNHGYYPCVWIQNLLDYKQKKSKEEKERLKRMSKMSKLNQNKKANKKDLNLSIDPKPIYTIFVTGNGCDNKTNVEYLDPKTKKWKILTKEIGDINIGKVKSIKNELFNVRRFTPFSIRDDILDRFQKKQTQNNNKYAIIDEL